MDKDDIINRLEELRAQLGEKRAEIAAFEIDPEKHENNYAQILDDCYPELFGMLPSRILRQCDPIQYNCGLTDYVDSMDLDDDPDYRELQEAADELQGELESLERDLEDLYGDEEGCS